MNEGIKEFIKKQTCANICCVDERGNPHCFSCYYAFNAEKGLLYFKSSADSKHSKILFANPAVAGTILPDRLNKLHVKGLQFEGSVLNGGHTLTQNAASVYYKRHPIAMTIPGDIWTIKLVNIKFTDNSFGFGKKIDWKRLEPVAEKNN